MNDLFPGLFHAGDLYLVEHEGEPWVPMRPIIEALGLSRSTQARKLRGSDRPWRCAFLRATAADNKRYDFLCIPLDRVAAFLLTIHAGRVREDLRPKLKAYQERFADACWHKLKPAGIDVSDLDGRIEVYAKINKLAKLRGFQGKELRDYVQREAIDLGLESEDDLPPDPLLAFLRAHVVDGPVQRDVLREKYRQDTGVHYSAAKFSRECNARGYEVRAVHRPGARPNTVRAVHPPLI